MVENFENTITLEYIDLFRWGGYILKTTDGKVVLDFISEQMEINYNSLLIIVTGTLVKVNVHHARTNFLS